MEAISLHDVGDDDFDRAVLDRSRQVPVLVDFWAPWCGPCRVLGPILERVANDLRGRLEVVKLNVDQNPITAARYRVQGIPAVKVFRGGELTAEFVGALPEAQVRAFLEEHLPNEAVAARLELARTALAQRDFDGVAAHAREVPASAREWEVAQALVSAAELGREAATAGAPAQLRDRLAASPPGEMADAFALAIHELVDGDPRAALERLLGLVERDRRWRDEAARRAMLTIFTLIGARSPLSDEVRRKLALLL